MLLQGSVSGNTGSPSLVAPIQEVAGQDGSASCAVCGKEFKGHKYKFRLRRHMIIHTGEKPFACPYCPHRANIRNNLTRHIFFQHSVVPPGGGFQSSPPVPVSTSLTQGQRQGCYDIEQDHKDTEDNLGNPT